MSQLTLWDQAIDATPRERRRSQRGHKIEAREADQLDRLVAAMAAESPLSVERQHCFVCSAPCRADELGHPWCTGRTKRDRTSDFDDISESERRVA